MQAAASESGHGRSLPDACGRALSNSPDQGRFASSPGCKALIKDRSRIGVALRVIQVARWPRLRQGAAHHRECLYALTPLRVRKKPLCQDLPYAAVARGGGNSIGSRERPTDTLCQVCPDGGAAYPDSFRPCVEPTKKRQSDSYEVPKGGPLAGHFDSSSELSQSR